MLALVVLASRFFGWGRRCLERRGLSSGKLLLLECRLCQQLSSPMATSSPIVICPFIIFREGNYFSRKKQWMFRITESYPIRPSPRKQH
jgi:hypothetical protein